MDLNISFDFKKECQESHEILSNYVKNTCEVKSEVKLEATDADTCEVDSEATDRRLISTIDVQNTFEVKLEATGSDTFEFADSEATDVKNISEVKLETTDADTYDYEVDSEATDVKNSCEIKSEPTDADTFEFVNCEAGVVKNTREVKLEVTAADSKKPSRLEPFSQHQVLEAIKDLKQKFYKNTNCIRCDYVGKHSRALSIHITRTHKDLKPHWCCICNAEFDDLSNHVETDHNDDYTCKFCSKKFQIIFLLIEHLGSHSDVKTFRCTFCEESFNRRRYLNLHLKRHSQMHDNEGDADKQPLGDRPNFCVKCNKKVPSLLTHTTCDDENHTCTVCGKQFKGALRLKQHMQVHEPRHKCTQCDKKYKTHSKLIIHKRTHTGERPYVCQVCGKSFASLSTLKGHSILHNVGPKISCNICEFRTPFKLCMHLRRYTGAKPYVCTKCGKSFSEPSKLLQHNTTHSDLRSYKCSYCDLTFKHSFSLKRHMRMHSEHEILADKSHVCLMCNSTFTTDALLKSHIHTHTVSFLEI